MEVEAPDKEPPDMEALILSSGLLAERDSWAELVFQVPTSDKACWGSWP